MEKDLKKQIQAAADIHKKMLTDFETNQMDTIVSAVEMIVDSLKHRGCLYICGNGGSAADAQHIAGEIIGRFAKERQGLPAVALTTDTSVITSIANDYGYDKIFSRQVEALVNKNDVLWAISTSGNSANVVAAAKLAKQKDASVLAFTGKPGSQLEKLSDVCFCVEAETTFRTQEMHQLVYHIICELVEQELCE